MLILNMLQEIYNNCYSILCCQYYNVHYNLPSNIDYSNIERPTADENLKTFEQAMSGQVNQQLPSPQPLNVSGSQPMPSPIFTSGIANIPTNMSNNLFSLLQNRG